MAKYKKKSVMERLLPQKGDTGVERARKIVTIVCFVVLVVSLAILAWYYVQQAKIKNDIDDQRKQHTTTSAITTMTTPPKEPTETTTVETEPPPLVMMDNIKSFVDENPHTAGWITIPNTEVDNVVLQTDNNDLHLDKIGRASCRERV